MPLTYKIPFDYYSLNRLSTDPQGYLLKSGDIGFYLKSFGHSLFVWHAFLFGCEVPWIIHSAEEVGVFSSTFSRWKKTLIFRFKESEEIPQKAAMQAFHWSRGRCPHGCGGERFLESTEQRVGYSSADWQKSRAVGAVFGKSMYGVEAEQRLDKYRERPDFAPKNVTCTEMVILAYQLSASEKAESCGFIKLDAKHSMPGTLAKYLHDNTYWEVAGRS